MMTARFCLVKMTAGLLRVQQSLLLSQAIEQPEANALRQGQNKK